MSRYEQQVEEKNLKVPIITVLTLLIFFAGWMFFKKQHDNETDVKAIDIPKEQLAIDSSAKVYPDIKSNGAGTTAQQQNTASNLLTTEEERLTKTAVDLPKLENSDEFFKHEVSLVSANLSNWFGAKNVIKKYIVLVNDLSQNQLIYKHKSFIKPLKKMVVKEDSKGFYLTKDSYRRYDSLANAIAKIDVDKGIQLYITFKPLFEEIYKEFAYPAEYRLEDVFLKAAANVVNAPIIEGRITLIRHPVKYKFADKNLESLSGIEKQMIRMGPENTLKIQNTLIKLIQVLAVLPE